MTGHLEHAPDPSPFEKGGTKSLDASISANLRSDVTTDQDVQAFWLENLLQADAFTKWVVEEISPYLGQRALEVGGGIGTYTSEFAARCRTVVSVDMEASFVEEARRRLAKFANVEVVCGDATQIELSAPNNRGFDTVILLDVLEHIELDVELLRRLYNRLSPGGHLIIKVPAMPSLYSPMDKAIGHWRRYNKSGLGSVMRQAGFDVVDVWQFNAFAVAGWWLNGRLLKRRSPPGEQIALFNRLVPILRPIDKVARRLCGISLIGVGRRPSG
jgi:2-polyprenyl-3-methyl-5-hydroxy-6-metoxy-1,4-benzoquinol methylase